MAFEGRRLQRLLPPQRDLEHLDVSDTNSRRDTNFDSIPCTHLSSRLELLMLTRARVKQISQALVWVPSIRWIDGGELDGDDDGLRRRASKFLEVRQPKDFNAISSSLLLDIFVNSS